VGRYVARRFLIAIPTLLIISFVVYAILALAPGDPLAQFAANPNVPPEVREKIRVSLGLDQPWHIQYVKWLLALLRGDFGYSFGSHSPVAGRQSRSRRRRKPGSGAPSARKTPTWAVAARRSADSKR